MKHSQRRVITLLVLGVLIVIGLAVALYPNQPTVARDQPAVYTVVSYAQAECTQNADPGLQECGPATIIVKTDSGQTLELHYDGKEPPEGHPTGPDALRMYRPGAKVELTTKGDEVIRAKQAN